MANVLVFAETRGGEVRKVALEAVTAARQLADASGGGEVHALVFGAAGIGAKASSLGTYGADVVIAVEAPELAQFAREAIAATVADRAKAGAYRAVVLAFRRRAATSARASQRSSMHRSRAMSPRSRCRGMSSRQSIPATRTR